MKKFGILFHAKKSIPTYYHISAELCLKQCFTYLHIVLTTFFHSVLDSVANFQGLKKTRLKLSGNF